MPGVSRPFKMEKLSIHLMCLLLCSFVLLQVPLCTANKKEVDFLNHLKDDLQIKTVESDIVYNPFIQKNDIFQDERLISHHPTKRMYSKWVLKNAERLCDGELAGIGSSGEPIRKYIECSPCMCIRDNRGLIRADCDNRGLLQIPRHLPRNVFSVNMASNVMKAFSISAVMMYPQLRELDLKENKISKVLGINHKSKVNKTFHFNLNALNFFHNKLSNVESDAFEVFPNLYSLQLARNLLKSVTNHTFKGLVNLIHLDLSSNEIEYLENEAFGDLSGLLALCLNQNQNLGYASKYLRTQIFKNLTNIRVFYLEQSSNGCIYFPNNVFDQMPLLEILSIDGINDVLFFKPMKNMNTIMIKYHQYCHIHSLSSATFKNSPHLKHVFITSCKIRSIVNDTFENNPDLQSLSLKYISTYDLATAFKEIGSMALPSLTALKLEHLYHGCKCRSLNISYANHIQHFKLETLDLTDNCLFLLYDEFLDHLPKSIKRLVLSKNMMNLSGNMWNRMGSLSNLEELIIDQQNTNMRLHYYNQAGHVDLISSEGVQIRNMVSTFQKRNNQTNSTSLINQQSQHTNKENTHNSLKQMTSLNYPHHIPTNLRTVNSSRYVGFGFILLHKKLNSDNKLQHLNFSSSFLNLWGTGYLPKAVETLDLSHNLCKVLNPDFFPDNNSLLYLDIKDNNLGVAFAEDIHGAIFSQLNKLRYLDISSNNIFHLPGGFFRGLTNLTTLVARENKLRVLNVTLKGLTSLNILDVSKNSIYHITTQTRKDIDQIVAQRPFAMNLQDNSISCTCDGLPLLNWMSLTNVILLNRAYLTCINMHGKVEYLGDLSIRLRKLESECQSKTFMYISLSIVSVFMSLFIITTLVYKQRWKLRYFKNLLVAKYLGFQPKERINECFTFDAYVVYDREDANFVCQDMYQELQEQRKHRLCFEDKDFIPGTIMTNNITCAVQNSTVTMFVVSPASITSPHVEYAIQMAIMEEHYNPTKRQILHLILYKDTEDAKIPTHLLALMKKDRYTELPLKIENGARDENIQQFWDTLSRFIGHVHDEV